MASDDSVTHLSPDCRETAAHPLRDTVECPHNIVRRLLDLILLFAQCNNTSAGLFDLKVVIDELDMWSFAAWNQLVLLRRQEGNYVAPTSREAEYTANAT